MIKLSLIQSHVLAELAWNARATTVALAKKLAVKPHTVRYAVDKLKHHLKLAPVCFTDPYRQGQVPFRIYFSINSSDASATQHLISSLNKRPEVQWFSALLGHYQFGMSLRVPSVARLEEIFTELDSECPGIVREKSISVLSSVEFFVPWLAHTGTGSRKSFSYRAGVNIVALDKVDRGILQELKQDPGASIDKIGKVLRIAPSTITYHLHKLIDNAVIIGFGTSCDSRAVNLESHLLFVSTQGFGAESYERLSQAVNRHPSVVWIARTLGQWDVELEVRVQSPTEVDDVTRLIYKTIDCPITKVTAHTWGRSYIW